LSDARCGLHRGHDVSCPYNLRGLGEGFGSEVVGGDGMAVFELEFAEDIGDVEFYGALGDAQGARDVFIGKAAHE
jgi:hypothetical protein